MPDDLSRSETTGRYTVTGRIVKEYRPDRGVCPGRGLQESKKRHVWTPRRRWFRRGRICRLCGRWERVR